MDWRLIPLRALIAAFVAVLFVECLITIFSFHDQQGSYKFYTRVSSLERRLSDSLLKSSKSMKIIVVWHNENELTEVLKKRSRKLNSISKTECGYCLFTTDKTMIYRDNTAAVLFFYGAVRSTEMPDYRRTDQLYVWRTGESSANIRFNKKNDLRFESMFKFNATMTYRRNSDIYRPYGGIDDYQKLLVQNTSWIMTNKTKWGAVVISNCGRLEATRRRLSLVKEIARTSKGRLETFGGCFDNPIPLLEGKKTAVREVLLKYKFYFAFENSYHCKDYITEKFFNAFYSNAIPIVWGATKSDYTAIAPPHSFIHVEDFETTNDLVNYLNILDKNDTAYLEYFRWRLMKLDEFGDVKRKTGDCQLCRIVHGINVDSVYNENLNASRLRPLFDGRITKRTVQNLSEWFYENENEDCMGSEI